MSTDNRFSDFVSRIRSGDSGAASRLVQEYEPLVRREIRVRLQDRRLRRLFDSMDVCQSVLAGFFAGASAGKFDLGEPRDLVRLLVTMARNKLASAARAQNRRRRDHRRAVGESPDQLGQIAGRDPTPSQQVARKELRQRLRRLLSDEEWMVAQLRAQGLGWAEVADRLGGTPQARRMQLKRAMQRASRQMGLDDA